MKTKLIITILLALLFMYSCSGLDGAGPYKLYKYKEHRIGHDLTAQEIELFENTRLWPLAQSVYEQDTNSIQRLCSNDPTIIDDTETKYGVTLLFWAVANNRFLSAEKLVALGANPNYMTRYSSPFIIACRMSERKVFIQFFIQHGAKINGFDQNRGEGETPLIAACLGGLQNVKMLVKAGADVNYVGKTRNSALYMSCALGDLDVIHYLIIECHVDFKDYFFMVDQGSDSGKYIYPIDYIKDIEVEKNTPNAKLKSELIEYIYAHDSTSAQHKSNK